MTVHEQLLSSIEGSVQCWLVIIGGCTPGRYGEFCNAGCLAPQVHRYRFPVSSDVTKTLCATQNHDPQRQTHSSQGAWPHWWLCKFDHLFGPLHPGCCPAVAPPSETRLASLIICLVRPSVRVLSVLCCLFLQPTGLGLAQGHTQPPCTLCAGGHSCT